MTHPMDPPAPDGRAEPRGRTLDTADERQSADPVLDAALARVLVPPGLPPGFERRLHERVAAAAGAAHGVPAGPAGLRAEVAAAVAQARAEHERQLAALRAGHVRLQRHTLAVVVATAFTAGVLAAWALPWARAELGLDLGLLVPGLALAVGMVSGAVAWVDRLGWPSWAALRPLRRFLSR
ncbi:hypothetical protein [Ideonella sp.]|uniref:hypothetical protein n=1 Tax=Ideonella sp. TaxID=1929293 RepID=UPI0035B07F8A